MSMINSIQIKGVTHELPSGASAVVEGTNLKIQNGNTVSSAINPAGFTYSMNEIVVGKWIDGKPIYRKVGNKSDNIDVIQDISLYEDGMGYIYTKGLIPTLTSNTSAADTVGTAIRNDYSNGCEAWKAMNNDKLTSDNCWYKNSRPCWLGFHFNNPVVVKSFFLRQEHNTPEYIRGFIFQASNDGNSWVDLGNYRMSGQAPGFEEGYSVDNDTEYTYYRWYFNDGPGGGISVQLAQMYDVNILDLNKIYEYTKKSDEPNSFTPAMLDITSVAVPKHTYSTEEQVVGTWIDGKPIYERFITIDGEVSDSGTLPLNKSDLKADQLINLTGVRVGPKPASTNSCVWSSGNNIEYKVVDYLSVQPECTNYMILQYTKTTD